MTEDEATRWMIDRYSDRFDAITEFLAMVRDENTRQNLIAGSTIDHMRSRHAVDSLQLVQWGSEKGLWIDIGAGGGFPGLMIALVRVAPMMLIEPRQKRASFLRDAARHFGLNHVEVMQAKAERVQEIASVISARAVGSIASLASLGKPWCVATTRWILPRGGVSDDDMVALTHRFGNAFHVEQSVTSPVSQIIVARGCPR